MRRDPSVYLYDIVSASKLIFQFVQGKSLEDYQSDPLLRSAVERQLQIVGEAFAQLAKTAPEIAEQFPEQRSIIGFRNVLVHAYADVDDLLVWDIVQSKLPLLLETATGILQRLGEAGAERQDSS
jgi:uncharacterized protein with HEPN domain